MEKEQFEEFKPEEEKPEVRNVPFIGIEIDPQGNISIRSNISNKIMIKHILESCLEIVIGDIQKEGTLVWVPGPNGMPVRRT